MIGSWRGDHVVPTFQSRINSAHLTTTGPRISKLGSNNFNKLMKSTGPKIVHHVLRDHQPPFCKLREDFLALGMVKAMEMLTMGNPQPSPKAHSFVLLDAVHRLNGDGLPWSLRYSRSTSERGFCHECGKTQMTEKIHLFIVRNGMLELVCWR